MQYDGQSCTGVAYCSTFLQAAGGHAWDEGRVWVHHDLRGTGVYVPPTRPWSAIASTLGGSVGVRGEGELLLSAALCAAQQVWGQAQVSHARLAWGHSHCCRGYGRRGAAPPARTHARARDPPKSKGGKSTRATSPTHTCPHLTAIPPRCSRCAARRGPAQTSPSATPHLGSRRCWALLLSGTRRAGRAAAAAACVGERACGWVGEWGRQ